MQRLSAVEPHSHVKTKIIATVGPACASREKLRELVLAGVDVFRLNFAHGQYDWLAGILASIRDVSKELKRPLGILGDLSGPKIRLESLFHDPLPCHPGARFEFVQSGRQQHAHQLTCTYAPLIDDLKPDDRVLLADGTVSLRVVEKHADEERVVCVVEQPGEIRSKQGINLPGVALSTPSLTDKDREDLAWAVQHEVDFIGLSFVRSADDIRLLRSAIDELHPWHAPQIVAKIEKVEAVGELDKILQTTDAVMVARGDLGVEVDLALVPTLQKRIIRLCNQHRIPVITATQMLDSMHRNSRPTRAEASDVANAVLDGTDAVMLSGETAIGEYPVEAVATMCRLAREAERLLVPMQTAEQQVAARARASPVTEAVMIGAAKIAERLSADLIVVATKSGRTALAVSRQRCSAPVLGLTDSPHIARQMCLLWGVTPLHTTAASASPAHLLNFAQDWGLKEKVLQSGSRVVLAASSNWTAQAHDMLMVHSVP